jgi:hypothetical protein
MTNTVFVGNLAATVTEDRLRALFAETGQVVGIKLLTARGKEPRFGFIDMGSEAEAAAAIERLNGYELDGQPLTVATPRPSAPKPQPANALFVKSLPVTVTQDQLRALFAEVGQVVKVKMGPLRPNKLLYAYVNMSSQAEALAALERLNGYELEGQPLIVKPFDPYLAKAGQRMAEELARKLGERSYVAVKQIELIITLCGRRFAHALLEETLAIQAAGGMLVIDQSRQRTTGGIFLHLARERADPETRKQLIRHQPKPASKKSPPAGDSPAKPPAVVLPPLVWGERFEVIQPLLAHMGKASNVKITLVGRPGQIEERQNLVVVVMEYAPTKTPTFPKGVPAPPQIPTPYVVYISAKQWQKVAEALADPEDKLIVEGMPLLDPEVSGISVFATNVTTSNLQAATRKPAPQAETPVKAEDSSPAQAKVKKAVSASKAAPAPKAVSGPKPAPAAPVNPPPAPAPQPTVSPTELPLGAIRKLEALRRQEDELRERLNEIKEQPPEEQIGLGKTLQELKQTQAEIKTLKQKYPRLS